MRRIAPVLIICLLSTILLYGQKSIAFEYAELTSKLPLLEEASVFKVKPSILESTLKDKSTKLNLIIPLSSDQNFILELESQNIFSPDFKMHAYDGSHKKQLKMPDALFYKGVLISDPYSQATISLIGDEIAGTIRTRKGIYNIGKYKGSSYHIIYKNSDYKEDLSLKCEQFFKDELEHSYSDSHSQKSSGSCAVPVDIYFECDYQMYLNFGSNETSVVNYVTTMFNEVHTIYSNENIPIQLSEINVWNVADPYSPNTSGLADFANHLNGNFNGDLAHLLTNDPGNHGGSAYVNQLCGGAPYAYSDIVNANSPYPTYSWDVQVVSHELGHNFGSRHTHDCVWGPNANEQIDDCGNLAAGGGGSCYDSANPIIPASGGTIMSYCHTQSVGINFNQGFGAEPGDLIRNRYADCKCDNSTCATATVITINGTYFAHPNNGNGASHNNATHADWFVFTPNEDGEIYIASCDQGVDTRVWIEDGICGSLNNIAYGDDECTSSGSSSYASEISGQSVTSGIAYYIEWDNRWSSASFIPFNVISYPRGH